MCDFVRGGINIYSFLDVSSLQKEDGSFTGDEWGEVDTRFSFCAIACLSLIKKLDLIDNAKAASFILSCQNFDGAFGVIPEAESHAGQSAHVLHGLSLISAS